MVATNTTHEVRVEAYRGPLDLLLYLIKDEEVDIYDIPIARILERYLEELARMEVVDINAAADFLLMAATLMEIKSRQLLPPEEREDVEIDEEDPRSDLVRQLLEYRRFRQAADDLGMRAEKRALCFGRFEFAMGLTLDDPAEEVDPAEELRNVEIFDLLSSFESLMKAILADAPRTIIYDDISVEERIEELVLSLKERAEQVRFTEFSSRAIDRADAAGIFTAILEATRRKLVTIFQPENLGELYVSLRGDRPDSDFTPPQDEQAQEPPRNKRKWGEKVERFNDFLDVEEAEDDLEFAFDLEGRKAISRLENAVLQADQAIENLSRPKARPEPEGPRVHQWTDDSGQVHEISTEQDEDSGGEFDHGGFEGRQQVIIRHWTDPDRSGTVVFIGAQGPEAAPQDRPRVVGHFKYVARRVQTPRLGRGRKQPRRLAAGAMPFKPRARTVTSESACPRPVTAETREPVAVMPATEPVTRDFSAPGSSAADSPVHFPARKISRRTCRPGAISQRQVTFKMIPVEERFDLQQDNPETGWSGPGHEPNDGATAPALPRVSGRSVRGRTLDRDGVNPSGVSESKAPGSNRAEILPETGTTQLEVHRPHLGRRIEEPHLGHWGPVRRRILESGHP